MVDNFSRTNTTAPAAPGMTVPLAVLSNVTAAVVLFGIACSVEVSHLRAAWRNKSVAVVALTSQWLVMPAMTCGFALAFEMRPHLAFALICVGCAPGGTSSNTLAYFSAGDQALSIFLTSVTNLLALGTLPLSLWAWTRGAALDFEVPYEQVILSLLVVLVPASGGVWLRERRPRTADSCERVGAILGAVVTLLTILVGILGNREALSSPTLLDGGAWASVALAAPSGMVFALLAICALASARNAACCRREARQEAEASTFTATDIAATATDAALGDAEAQFGKPQAVTVILETGIQNVPLALAVINVTLAHGSYSAEQVLGAQLMAGLWSALTTTQGVLVVLLSRWQQGLPLCPRCPQKPARRRGDGAHAGGKPVAAA